MKLTLKEKQSTLKHFVSFNLEGHIHKDLKTIKEQKIRLHSKFDQALQLQKK